eukprot:gene7110-7324_t
METSTQETAAWNPADYVWDPYRLVAAQGSSATNLHLNVAAAGSQPDSVVPPIEGCQQLLKDEKPYYQRFMVCEEHMRSLSLQINGQSCRFCQQCGRFEPLQAFDGAKRSCRARLQEHNKRRRKDAEMTPADSSNVCNKLRKLAAGECTGGSESSGIKHMQPQYNILAAADSGSERALQRRWCISPISVGRAVVQRHQHLHQ